MIQEHSAKAFFIYGPGEVQVQLLEDEVLWVAPSVVVDLAINGSHGWIRRYAQCAFHEPGHYVFTPQTESKDLSLVLGIFPKPKSLEELQHEATRAIEAGRQEVSGRTDSADSETLADKGSI